MEKKVGKKKKELEKGSWLQSINSNSPCEGFLSASCPSSKC
jgi:hypothetical protein